VSALALGSVVLGQEPKPAPGGSAAGEPTTVIKATTHMVALQVVARDSKGLPVSGLTAKDFEVFEQIAPKKELRPQRVAAFQAVSLAASGAAGKSNLQMPSGVYSNLLSTQTQTVPPTILVVDGLNTSVAGQMQVRRQMVKLLGSIPAGIPTAVFLMGRNLHLLQNFTTDPKLLHDAVQKALSLDSTDLAGADSRDDPNALTTLVADVPPPRSCSSCKTLKGRRFPRI
jgi:VWFA-related protein